VRRTRQRRLFNQVKDFQLQERSIRYNVPRIRRILIARGRDATDDAISSTFTLNKLVSFKVHTDEVAKIDERLEPRRGAHEKLLAKPFVITSSASDGLQMAMAQKAGSQESWTSAVASSPDLSAWPTGPMLTSP